MSQDNNCYHVHKFDFLVARIAAGSSDHKARQEENGSRELGYHNGYVVVDGLALVSIKAPV